MKSIFYIFLLAFCVTLASGCFRKYPSYAKRLQEAQDYVALLEIGISKAEVRDRLSFLDKNTVDATNPHEIDVDLRGWSIRNVHEHYNPGDLPEWIEKRCSTALIYNYQYFGREKKYYEGKGTYWKIPNRIAIYFDKTDSVIGWSYEVDKY